MVNLSASQVAADADEGEVDEYIEQSESESSEELEDLLSESENEENLEAGKSAPIMRTDPSRSERHKQALRCQLLLYLMPFVLTPSNSFQRKSCIIFCNSHDIAELIRELDYGVVHVHNHQR